MRLRSALDFACNVGSGNLRVQRSTAAVTHSSAIARDTPESGRESDSGRQESHSHSVESGAIVVAEPLVGWRQHCVSADRVVSARAREGARASATPPMGGEPWSGGIAVGSIQVQSAQHGCACVRVCDRGVCLNDCPDYVQTQSPTHPTEWGPPSYAAGMRPMTHPTDSMKTSRESFHSPFM